MRQPLYESAFNMPHKVHDSPSTYDSSIRYSVTSVEELHRKDGMTGLYAAFSLPENITEQLSPAQAEFAFAEEEHDKEAQYDRTFDNLVGRRDNGQDETENRNAYVVSPLEPKARAQYFENRIRPKETTVLTARQRALKSAPVIAHLRTNVIVRTIDITNVRLLVDADRSNHRSRMNTRSSQTSRIIYRRATIAPKLVL